MKTVTRSKMVAKNKDHNLWRHNKNWWLHYTMRLPDLSLRRVRLNLWTADVKTARMHRDMILHDQNIIKID